MKLLTKQFCNPPLTYFLLCPNILLSTLFSDAVISTLQLNVKTHASQS
jgi:hypothetical protein